MLRLLVISFDEILPQLNLMFDILSDGVQSGVKSRN